MTGGKFVNTSFDLETKIVGKGEGALSNIILFAQRIEVSAKNVYGNKRPSHKQIKDMRNIIKNYDVLKPYIETLKQVDDEVTEVHNKLYGEEKKV